jgi:hypothetical protein
MEQPDFNAVFSSPKGVRQESGVTGGEELQELQNGQHSAVVSAYPNSREKSLAEKSHKPRR